MRPQFGSTYFFRLTDTPLLADFFALPSGHQTVSKAAELLPDDRVWLARLNGQLAGKKVPFLSQFFALQINDRPGVDHFWAISLHKRFDTLLEETVQASNLPTWFHRSRYSPGDPLSALDWVRLVWAFLCPPHDVQTETRAIYSARIHRGLQTLVSEICRTPASKAPAT